jgi:hypothetical protein
MTAASRPHQLMRAPKTADTAKLLDMKSRIEGLSTADKLRFCAGLLDADIYEPIVETLLDRVVVEMRSHRRKR